ncbi:TPA: conjugal transfer protein TraG N-terminal domain-containing protein [Pasteurella multocida]|uniref:conjugal transfer protein TraG N-terminal domain-containing protein n=1 Tax=Pasteurella multocida TaxID=747 RepID=UPI001093EF3B|nr:conjugal transfer protein TraG N-terminal domain-containing protein [Pasteurella multocida]QCA32161.1 conjugal transfer protein TraG [Pasteurella multocida]QXG51767.1 conjugal transfer protein TraG N-terminal domain-containing protein [Pasteurella multocida]WGE13652.1 conjugal transfer protein TraG N-terminal domain-containing protein [Pasteurella multocida]HDX0990419.1 conjugal transfer protein TraG N-terminal domain-containing protein [Pasteurella multocida]HDX1015686.1 conjugal transfer 
MTFTVDSYLEYFLTLLAWIINNNIFAVLIQTGIFLIPLIVILFKTWIDVKKQGEDEGNKGEMLINWLGLQFFPAMFVIVIVMAPVLPIHLNNIELNVEQSKACGYRVPQAPKESGYGDLTSELGGKQAKVPLWWGFFHQLNKGVTHALVSAIPCKPDLRQIRFEVQHEKINDPALLTELRQFVTQCYIPARQKLQTSQISLTPAQVREVSWLGGHILVSNSELYPRYRAKQPNNLWAYDAKRDTGLPNTGEGGFPTCDAWWAENNIGLKYRLLEDVRQNFSAKVVEFFSTKDGAEESLLRAIVRPENLNVSGGKVYPGYGGNLDATFANATNKLVASVGSVVGSFGIFPALDSMRQALPMVHAFALMSIVILLPIIIVMSGYSLKTVITLTFVHFALVALTFWWELARWLDSWLLDVLYNSATHNRLNPFFLENTEDDFIVNFVMGSLFLVLPAIWMGAISWAGVNIGNMAQQLTNGSRDSKSAGQQGGDSVKSGVKTIGSGI